jgi:hypothetical protein
MTEYQKSGMTRRNFGAAGIGLMAITWANQVFGKESSTLSGEGFPPPPARQNFQLVDEAETRRIVAACKRLCLDYAHFADNRLGDERALLFAEDAEMIIGGKPYPARSGANGISEGPRSLHVITNIQITPLSIDEAEGAAYLTRYIKALHGTAIKLTPNVLGIYRDKYRRTSEGWRFACREFVPFRMART